MENENKSMAEELGKSLNEEPEKLISDNDIHKVVEPDSSIHDVDPADLAGLKVEGLLSAEFQKELEDLINKYSVENGSDTPDFLLASYLMGCLLNFNTITQHRDKWYNFNPWGSPHITEVKRTTQKQRKE